jgi:hypothetical protein
LIDYGSRFRVTTIVKKCNFIRGFKLFSRNSGSIGIGGEMRGLLAFNSSTGVSSSDSTQVQQDTYATSTRQKADENGVPVGDGWKILAVMVVIYSFYKARKAGLLNFSKNYFSQKLSKDGVFSGYLTVGNSHLTERSFSTSTELRSYFEKKFKVITILQSNHRDRSGLFFALQNFDK